MAPLGFAKVGWQGGAGFSPVVASGGTTSTYTEDGVEYKAHTFTGSGTWSVTDAGSEGLLEIMVLGGGGSGGGGGATGGGGAGGAGGMLVETATITATGSYAITVGAGGAGQRWRSSDGNRGNDSKIANPSSTVIANGRRGGAGGSSAEPGFSGGSGGGSGDVNDNSGAREFDTTNYPSTAQGNAGYRATGNTQGGGGGGAGGTTGSSQTVQNRNPQIGLTNTYRDGSTDKYAGGGAGSGITSMDLSWGGERSPLTGGNNKPCPANQGGGSGGNLGSDIGGKDNWATSNGGSGIVIIRYLTGN